ncbi:sulfatase-like hydrolase/transferase [Nocardia mangyaensis]|nr:sulfatase-like hydrolase/transferase [Nocardia mangyaensis]MDO3650606.1 sulfatase-like hydrolase/transferase [Nocardia mangyaensis]
MVDSIDQSPGRLVDTREQLGELDNTIIVFTSDDGGTAEGGPEGTRTYFAQFANIGRSRIGRARSVSRTAPGERERSNPRPSSSPNDVIALPLNITVVSAQPACCARTSRRTVMADSPV